MNPSEKTTPGHFHAVRFYQDGESLCRIVTDFLGEGLDAGHPCIVIATQPHRAGIVDHLRRRAIDVPAAERNGDLLLLDAEEMLAKFMVGGTPDHRKFDSSVGALLRRVCRARQDSTLRAYGEMVDVLWKAGQSVAAIKLEMLWNSLSSTQEFSLLCGYAMGNFYKDATGVEEICRHHSHLVSDSADTAAVA